MLDNNEITLKIRADEERMKNARPIHNKALLARYEKRIQIIDIYYKDAEVVKARQITEVDPLRYPQNPDDIYVVFFWKGNVYEKMWVRCERYLDTDEDGFRHFTGRLLNKPDHDYGFHIGSKVKFALFVEDNLTVCMGSGQ